MKKAIIAIISIAVLTAAVLFSGCTVTGPGKVVTEEKEFAGFTYVDVEGTFEVEIVQSESFSITVSADENFFDYVTVTKIGETLRIYLNPRHTFTDFTLQARILKAEITMPALYGLQLSGASKGTVTGFESPRNFSLDVSGASSLEIDNLIVGDVDFEISGASQVTGTMNASGGSFRVSGASEVKLEGSAKTITLVTSGASVVNLADFTLDSADIKLSGASEASLNVRGRLDAVLTAASRLYFHGNPTMGDISVSGASTIKHR